MVIKNKRERLIHIKVESKVLSITELLPESKVVGRLIDIRDGWLRRMREGDKLLVKTCVHNPTLF